MAGPITWRNVNGPALSDGVAAPMLAAQRSFDTAFSRAGDELTRRENTNTQNYETGKVNNTEAFLAQLAQFRTPEELQAAQASGLLDTMRQGFGAQVDQAAIRQAQDLRPSLLQERALKNNQYQDAQTALTERPIVEAIQAATAAGDSNTFNQLIEQNPTLRNRAALLQGWDTRNAASIKAGREDITFQQAQTLAPLQAQEIQGRIANTALNAKTAAENARTGLLNAEAAAEERAQRRKVTEASLKKAGLDANEAEHTRFKSNTVLADGTLSTSDGMTRFNKEVDALKLNKAEQVDLLHNLNEYAPNGVYKLKAPDGSTVEVDVPVSVAIAALRASEENWLANAVPGWSRRGDNFDNILRAKLMDPGVLAQIKAVGEHKTATKNRAALLSGATSNPTPQEAAFQANGGKPLPK